MPLSFVFDPNRCTGCQACQLACVIENELEPDASWREVSTFNPRHYPTVPQFHVSLACNHCAEAACKKACPAMAYSRDPATGAVLVDPDKCIGCKYCTWACPFDAPKFDAAAGVVRKCTFCDRKLKDGLDPACVISCPTGALAIDKIPTDAIANEIPGFPVTDLGPAIGIKPVHSERTIPEFIRDVPTPSGSPILEMPESKITLRSEWPLILFTLVAPFLVGLIGAAASTGMDVALAVFLAPAVVAMAFGGAHLGRKDRAWRIVLNVANSWLSREIVLFSSFAVAGTAYLWLWPHASALGWVVTAHGFVTLITIDMVYQFGLRRGPNLPHSASVFLTGLLFAGVLSGNPALVGAAGVTKAALYVLRKARIWKPRPFVHAALGFERIGLGLVLPGVLWGVGYTDLLVLVACVFLGELIDRSEFYAEMEIQTPNLQISEDLARMIDR